MIEQGSILISINIDKATLMPTIISNVAPGEDRQTLATLIRIMNQITSELTNQALAPDPEEEPAEDNEEK
jgi:hypothetical protein